MTSNESKKTVAIIPNYNGSKFLAPCIDALLTQRPVAPDVIVVDNCSTDDSRELVRNKYPRVQLIEMDANQGFAVAVNAGIRATDHEMIALVNNDAIVQPGWLAALEDAMDAHPSAAGCAPRVLLHSDNSIIDSIGDEVTPYGFVYKRGHLQKDDGGYDEPREVFAVSAVATLFRRRAFDDVGLFDEDFFAYYEDIDLCLRARLSGYKFRVEPRAVALHHYSATSGSQMKLGAEEVYLHLTGTWIKSMPGAILLKRLSSVLLFHSVIFAAVLMARIRGKSRLPRVPIVRFLCAMLRKRSKVQRARTVSTAELESVMSDVSAFSALRARLAKSLGK